MRILYKVVELTVLGHFPPVEKKIQRKQKVQNKLYMRTIGIWGVTDIMDRRPSLCRLSPDEWPTISRLSAEFESVYASNMTPLQRRVH